MIFIGLLWVTSWIGSFLSLNQNLPPSLTSNTLSAKVSSNLRKPSHEPHPFLMPVGDTISVVSITMLPPRFLKLDWGDKKSKPNATESTAPLIKRDKNSKNQFCGLQQENPTKQSTVKKVASFLPVPSLIETGSEDRDFLPNQILRSLQNFFRLDNPIEPGFDSTSAPVVVVNRGTSNYEVWLNNRVVANLPDRQQASLMQQRLTRLVKSSNFDASQLRPALVDGIPALMSGNRFLFGIGKEVTRKTRRSGDLLAIEWVNNLRQALQVPRLSLVEGQKEMYGLTSSRKKMAGLASWYGPYFHGRMTANGETFNQNELTVAHKSLPFNTYLQVTNLKNGKTVIVRVNDRGPYIPPRSLDLSRVAARCIDSELAGVVPYEAVILNKSEPRMTLKNLSLKMRKPPRKLAIISE
ncbi:septal ring lytic transglycosylase RlpA family protein [Scytonema sp. UIC 10036]|uniref:septal ring lytic transglycosylase RlpA family protein n=1 Tax=Scytonema sp. UIC 10036 TaxID=2304196 RepID=UPI0012DA4137|nr:septal ring lytic transglycosylase RlpA family protein [Scytonema sp. UIC 10036]MUH00976.1 septal ring lytic transglycosylase RlpA family protein [Scytonema sp. UIC 10036]